MILTTLAEIASIAKTKSGNRLSRISSKQPPRDRSYMIATKMARRVTPTPNMSQIFALNGSLCVFFEGKGVCEDVFLGVAVAEEVEVIEAAPLLELFLFFCRLFL